MGNPVLDERGRIRVHLRFGVTGHRRLANVDGLSQALLGAVDRYLAGLPLSEREGTRVSLRVLSALAEGADQFVADEMLKRGADLEVILPFDPVDYVKSFESLPAQRRFSSLRLAACCETVMPLVSTQEEAYLRCGQRLVDLSDVIVAIWDGQEARSRGGTAEIVAYARHQFVPLIWIGAESPHDVVPMIGGEVAGWRSLSPLSSDAWRQLNQYNRPVHRIGRTIRGIPERSPEPMVATRATDELNMAEARAWAAPYHIRAEYLARFFERWYKRVGLGLFSLSFLAVMTVAFQEQFVERHPGVTWVEVVLLISIVAGLFVAGRLRIHERWITARYLAEFLRSAPFLAVAGIGDNEEHPSPRSAEDDPTEAWIRRAFSEVWSIRPRLRRSGANFRALQDLIVRDWIEDQVAYYSRSAEESRHKHQLLTRAAYVLFALGAFVAVLHSWNIPHGRPGGFPPWSFTAAVAPAAAAAISGIIAQRQYRQHAERYARLARQLEDLGARMRTAADLNSLQELVLETERIMRQEKGEWFGAVRFRVLELPA